MTGLEALRKSFEEREGKLQDELEKMKNELGPFCIQKQSWEEGLATKEAELGKFQKKLEGAKNVISSLESKALELSIQVGALQQTLEDFKSFDEENGLYKEGKQAGGKDLILLIQDEYPNISFDFLFE
ncbi:Uncharacterized protein Fot_21721 [Forsythia ovata]|uniref:Uncharacterized protein n=1 Tax=Forsythia ovata TaxID=205694 RepID=A0ABD1UVN7_9LAMI